MQRGAVRETGVVEQRERRTLRTGDKLKSPQRGHSRSIAERRCRLSASVQREAELELIVPINPANEFAWNRAISLILLLQTVATRRNPQRHASWRKVSLIYYWFSITSPHTSQDFYSVIIWSILAFAGSQLLPGLLESCASCASECTETEKAGQRSVSVPDLFPRTYSNLYSIVVCMNK